MTATLSQPAVAVNRRRFLTGLGAVLAAPAIVRAGALMPVKAVESEMIGVDMGRYDWTSWVRVRFVDGKMEIMEGWFAPPTD